MRYKIFLVDDEEWILSGLKEAVEWEKAGFCVSGAYTNGKEALEAIEKDPPDAILSDIKMPILDGISMVKEMRSRGWEQIEVVFLSGYDDFELAQSSLRLGAADYVLKPCAPEEIEEVFGRIKDRLDKRHQAETEQLAAREMLDTGTLLFRNAVYHAIMYEQEQTYQRLLAQYAEFAEEEKRKTLQVISVALSGTIEGIVPDQKELEAIEFLKETASLNMEHNGSVHLISNGFSFSYVFLDAPQKEIEYLIHELEREIRKRTGKHLNYGKSLPYRGFHTLSAAYNRSLNQLYQMDDDSEQKKLFMGIENDTILKAAIADGDQQIVLWSLKNWVAKIDGAEEQYQWKLFRHLLYVMSVFMLQRGHSVWSIQNLYGLLKTEDYHAGKEKMISFVKAEFLSHRKEGDKNANMCREVAKYISMNYAENITLQELSEIFYISPNYLGTLFKRYFGIGIKEYQVSVRMEQAEVLIASGKFKLYQVAEMVGYPNYEYFRKIYCRHYGRNPSE